MPFGLCNAAQRMCRLMDKVIPAALRENVFVYLDDLLVCSPTFEEHLNMLRQVSDCLRRAKLTINVDKTCTLRSGYHEALGLEPYYAMFGTRMVTHASAYAIMRQLGGVSATDQVVCLADKMELTRDRVNKGLARAHEKAERTYNTRSREVEFAVGQVVYRKNYRQSNRAEGYNAKLGPNRVRCVILKRQGNSLYELGNGVGKSVGIYHAKDLYIA
ncbi:hypothetical protein KR084_005749 [Drosophila pseudotakahashii]|nr:hypothetical protein KR084_005749 [Drosophila pseudotakahashii]